MQRPTLSLVIPVFNEEAIIPELDRRLRTFLGELKEVGREWEVVFVNDGSKDGSLTMSECRPCEAKQARFVPRKPANDLGAEGAERGLLADRRTRSKPVMDAPNRASRARAAENPRPVMRGHPLARPLH